MTTQQVIDPVTPPSDASPEVKAKAKALNALARKINATVARRDLARARHDSIAAEYKGRWLGPPTHLNQQAVRDRRKSELAQRDIDILVPQYRQAFSEYKAAESGATDPIPATTLTPEERKAQWLANAKAVIDRGAQR